jgi:regulator of cell morphogenesis and NO signaling
MESNFSMAQIMQRYDLAGDKSLLYSYEELRRIDIDQQFIYTLLRTFEDERSFSEKEYLQFSLETIIDYIRRTHRYYLTKKLREIEQSIDILLKDYSGSHPLLQILHNFFTAYSADLIAHIRAEEKHLLPYIKCLLKVEKKEAGAIEYFKATKNYSLQAFTDSHHDTEKDLSDVRTAILQYNPPATNKTPYRILLSQLQYFEKDLAVHALIEDKVLIPRAAQLELKLKGIFSPETKWN